MMDTVRLCKEHNVKIGAHPGLPDLQGFGRREMKLQPEELTAITVYQVGALKAFLDREGLSLNHVKPHGVLYGMMCRDLDVASAVMKGIPKGVPIFGLAGTNMEKAAKEIGVEFWCEMYGDVKYNADGMLVIDRIKKYTARDYKLEDEDLLTLAPGRGSWKMWRSTLCSNLRPSLLRLWMAVMCICLSRTTRSQFAVTQIPLAASGSSRPRGQFVTSLTKSMVGRNSCSSKQKQFPRSFSLPPSALHLSSLKSFIFVYGFKTLSLDALSREDTLSRISNSMPLLAQNRTLTSPIVSS